MAFETHGFMRDGKWYEDLGHIVLGLLVPLYGVIREARQWPPASDKAPPVLMAEVYYAQSRVRDAYRDFSGYLIGSQLAIMVLVGLLIWRW